MKNTQTIAAGLAAVLMLSACGGDSDAETEAPADEEVENTEEASDEEAAAELEPTIEAIEETYESLANGIAGDHMLRFEDGGGSEVTRVEATPETIPTLEDIEAIEIDLAELTFHDDAPGESACEFIHLATEEIADADIDEVDDPAYDIVLNAEGTTSGAFVNDTFDTSNPRPDFDVDEGIVNGESVQVTATYDRETEEVVSEVC